MICGGMVDNINELKSIGETALVVIDIQKGIASLSRKLEPYPLAEVVGNVSRLLQGFRKAGSPVFLVHVDFKDGKDALKPVADLPMAMPSGGRPKDWAEFSDEVGVTESDIIITKRQWGAFYGTELDLQLRRRGVKTIVLCGISTNIGVETTAREAYQHGYNQIFAIDAMAAMSAEEHESTRKFIFPRIGVVKTTAEILSMFGISNPI